MESFQAKISWERLRKRENNKNRSNEFLPDPQEKIQKKITKKLKNTIVACFEAKISWERPRKREKKKRKKSFR